MNGWVWSSPREDYKAGRPTYNVTVISDGRHNAFPALAYCADRSLFLGYRKASSHTGVDGTLVAKRSTDNGDTWSAESTIATLASRDLRDPMFTTIGSDLWISYFAYNQATALGVSVRFQKSADNGATWDTPRVVSDAFSGSHACSASIVNLGSGVMVMPVYGIDSTRYLCKLLRSADSGATWGVYGTIATDAALDYTEPYVIKLADDSLFATLRNNTSDKLYNSTSTDGGATWSALTLAVNPGSGRPSMILNADGVIRMAYRTTPSTTRLTAVVTSADSGATWTPATAFGTTGIYTYAQWIEPIDGQRAVSWSEEPAGGWLGSVSAVYFRKTTDWPSTLYRPV